MVKMTVKYDLTSIDDEPSYIFYIPCGIYLSRNMFN